MSIPTSSPSNSASSIESQLSLHSAQLVEICDEYMKRVQSGESVTVAEYQTRYPHLAEAIEASLEVLATYGQNISPPKQSDPKTIAGHTILRRIGAGAMGTVYEALHPKLSRRMAIKVLSPGAITDDSRIRFLREAEVCSRISHPHIVPFIDYGTEGDLTYMSMHYIDGIALDAVLNAHFELRKSSGLSTQNIDSNDETIGYESRVIGRDYRAVAALGADVADALNCAHEIRVIHRDIKPGNLILDRQGKIWVTDFGLAKAQLNEDNLNISHGMVGTPRYMAPEQIRGVCSHQSDIYALGVTLYELASGQTAWQTVSRKELLKVRDGLELPHLSEVAPEVPSELAKIIMKACRLKPEDRYESAGELANVLTRFSETGKIGDRRSRERYEGQQYVRRKPLWIAAACLSAISLIWVVWSQATFVQPEPLELLAMIDTDEVIEQISQILPDEDGSDTSSAREKRKRVSVSLRKIATELLHDPSASQRDQDNFKQWLDEAQQGFVDGEVTREMMAEINTRSGRQSEAGISNRLKSMQKEILHADLTAEEKMRAMMRLEKLANACMEGSLQKRAADDLDRLLPELGAKFGANGDKELKAALGKIQKLMTKGK